MDIALHYEERGTGEPLLLLHGNGENGQYFAHQMEAFSRYFRVIAVDTRGHGLSPRGTAPFTLSQFVEDLAQFMDSLGLQRAHLLGFSDGGNIALLFALRYPERVDRLVLNGANLNPGGVRFSVQLPIILGWGAATLAAGFDRRAEAKRELLRLMVCEPQISLSALSTLQMPVLVIAGTRDMIRESHTRTIAAAIPNAELRLIEGNHFVAAKNHAAFNAWVLRFLCADR